MYYVFVASIFFLPLFTCFELRHLAACNHLEISGRLFYVLQFKAVGWSAIYFALLLANIIFFGHGVLGGPTVLNKHSEWHYTLVLKKLAFKTDYAHTQQKKMQFLTKKEGLLQISQTKNNVITVDDLSHKLNIITDSEFGLYNGTRILIPLTHSIFAGSNLQSPTLVAYGISHALKFSLPVYSLQDKQSNPEVYVFGSLTLTRVLPVFSLYMVNLLPLLLMATLSKLGAVELNTVNDAHWPTFKKLTGYISHIKLFSHGIFSSYLFLFLLFLLILPDRPNMTSVLSAIIHRVDDYRFCKRIAGYWHQKTFVFDHKLGQYKLQYVGGLNIVCSVNIKNAYITGFNNPTNFNYASKDACLHTKHIKGENWKIDLIGVIDNELIGIYEAAETQSDIGFVQSTLHQQASHQTLYFYDFRNFSIYPTQRNYGQIQIYLHNKKLPVNCNTLYKKDPKK